LRKQTSVCTTFRILRPFFAKWARKLWNCFPIFVFFWALGLRLRFLVVHQPWRWFTARPPLSIWQISSRYDNPSTRYFLPNFVDFVDSVTDKNSKGHVSACRAATKMNFYIPFSIFVEKQYSYDAVRGGCTKYEVGYASAGSQQVSSVQFRRVGDVKEA